MNSSSFFLRHCRSVMLRGVLLASVFVLLWFATHTIATAQCTPNPCPADWLCSTATVNIPNLSCPTPPSTLSVTVTYCYPDPSGPVGPKTQIDIKKLNVQPACVITGASMEMIKEKLIESVASSIVPCNQMASCSEWCDNHPTCFCPSAYAEWSVSATACMKYKTDGSTGYDYNSCGVGTCISLYQVCCRNGNADAQWLATQADEGNCLGQQDCVPLCSSGSAGLTCCDENGDPKPCEGIMTPKEEENSSKASSTNPALSGTEDTGTTTPTASEKK